MKFFCSTICTVGQLMQLAPPAKEVAVMKINLKKIVRKIDLSKIDWDFWLRVGTFLAAVWNALK